MAVGPETRTILLVGFLGAFTTFSTFAFETGAMLEESEYALAAGNVLGQTVLGLLAVVGGMAIGRML